MDKPVDNSDAKESSSIDPLLRALEQQPSTVNPAVELYWKLRMQEESGSLNLDEILLVQAEIQDAINAGNHDIATVKQILSQLSSIPAHPIAKVALMGF